MNAIHEEPYIFQMGKYQGKTVEEIIFKDPAFISTLLNRQRDSRYGNSSLYEHLNLLMEKIPETKAKCPVCREKTVKYFLFLNSEDIYESLVCCENADCKNHLRISHPNDYLLPLKLSSLLPLKQKRIQKSFISLMKKVTGLKKMTPELIHTIFIGPTLKQA